VDSHKLPVWRKSSDSQEDKKLSASVMAKPVKTRRKKRGKERRGQNEHPGKPATLLGSKKK